MQPLVIQIHISPAEMAQCAMAAPAADPPADTAPTIPGTVYGGGLYYGRIRIGDQIFALIRAPRAQGETTGAWNKSLKSVEGALSYHDGAANTRAMAAAGSKIAKWALEREINGCTDWYIPSQDELEIAYRALKPGTGQNWCYARSGINLNAELPTAPYTPDAPGQTAAQDFHAGKPEALSEAWYWSSTQDAAYSDFAWGQYFVGGYQYYHHKNHECSVFLVRRELIR